MRSYVITGGPGCGKTSVIDELSRRGYATVPDSGRQIISEEHQRGQIRDFFTLRRKIIRRQLELEARVTAELRFLDYGLVENIAFAELQLEKVPAEFAFCKTKWYNGVFLLERLHAFTSDPDRLEDAPTSRRLHERITELYTELGYSVVRVPEIPVNERVEMILNSLQN